MTGDLAVAEDAVQEACLAALAQWPDRGWPDQPRAWLTGVARHKAVDLIRREAVRSRKEAAAMRDLTAAGPPEPEPGLWPWRPRFLRAGCLRLLGPLGLVGLRPGLAGWVTTSWGSSSCAAIRRSLSTP